MSVVKKDRRYTDTHEWIMIDQGDSAVGIVGITDYAQSSLGDVAYVARVEAGSTFEKGAEVTTIDSVKASSGLYAPMAGSIEAFNDELESSPGLINSNPYDSGWVFKLRLDKPLDLDSLLSSDEYEKLIADGTSH